MTTAPQTGTQMPIIFDTIVSSDRYDLEAEPDTRPSGIRNLQE